jgi:hypothetical protein
VLKASLLVLSIFIFSGCTHLLAPSNSFVIEKVNWSVKDIEQTVSAHLPVGVRARSPNGREILSKHFVKKKKEYVPAAESLVRYFAKVQILNDRRPFDVVLVVIKEERVLEGDGFTYRVVGNDLRLATELDRVLRAELTKRREDRNIIDDFRVF